jgi:hypothetical protein
MPTTVRFEPYVISHDVVLRISDPYDPTNEDHDFGWRHSGDIDDPLLTFDLTGDHKWSELRASVEASLAPEEIKRILPPTSMVEKDSMLLLSIRCPATKLRQTIRLEYAPIGRWRGEIQLRRSTVRSAVELYPLLVRTSTIPGEPVLPGLARTTSAIIADGGGVRLRIDASEPSLKGALSVEWEDFRESRNTWRKAHASDLFHLDLDGSEPKVWLNSAYSSVKSSLHSTTVKGPEAMIRHLVNALIAQTVWMQLFVAATGSLVHDEDLGEIQGMDGWRGRVLADLTSKIMPERAEEDRIPELVDRFRSQEQIAALLSEAGTAVQGMLPTYQLVEKAIRAGEGMD